MAVAALYDIHGNLPALEAVLAAIQREAIDEIVVGGDVYVGPMSAACHELLLGLDMPVRYIMGNTDRETLAMARGEDTGGVPERYRAAFKYEADHLDDARRRAVESWPANLQTKIDGEGGEVLFCHATPRNDTEIFTKLTPEPALREAFSPPHVPAAVSLVVCGHTHMQFDRTITLTDDRAIRIVNAGSVGMPFGDPGAYWLQFDGDVKFRHTPYDYEAAITRIRESNYPEAADFANHNVAEPPTEEEMVTLYTQAGLK